MKRMLGAIVLAMATAAFVVVALVAHTATPKTIVQPVVPADAPQKQASTTPAPTIGGPAERVSIGLPSSTATLRPCIPPECHTTP